MTRIAKPPNKGGSASRPTRNSDRPPGLGGIFVRVAAIPYYVPPKPLIAPGEKSFTSGLPRLLDCHAGVAIPVKLIAKDGPAGTLGISLEALVTSAEAGASGPNPELFAQF